MKRMLHSVCRQKVNGLHTFSYKVNCFRAEQVDKMHHMLCPFHQRKIPWAKMLQISGFQDKPIGHTPTRKNPIFLQYAIDLECRLPMLIVQNIRLLRAKYTCSGGPATSAQSATMKGTFYTLPFHIPVFHFRSAHPVLQEMGSEELTTNYLPPAKDAGS